MKHTIASAFLALSVTFGASISHAAVVVGAPDLLPSAWVSQSGVPPAGPVFNYAAEFSLSSDTYVTTVDLFLYGTDAPAELNISLVTALDSGSPLYSADYFISGNTTQSFSLPINAVLPAATYFLRVLTNGFVGWQLGDTSSLVETGGDVAEGQWQVAVTSGGSWNFIPGSEPFGGPGNFAVNGLDAVVPLPAAWLFLMSGIAAAGIAKRCRRQAR